MATPQSMGIPPERASYRRTTTLALAAALVLAVGAVAAVRLPAPWASVASSILAVTSVGCARVVVAGFVVLHRDDLERRGLPDVFYRHFGRDPSGRYDGWRRGPRQLLGSALRPGDHVRLRDAHEILATLDAAGCTEGLPFMPEMLAWLGQDGVVDRRIDKINDWMGGNERRRTTGIVTLVRARCGGQAHGGCQAGCQILWRDEWLRRARRGEGATADRSGADELAARVRAATQSVTIEGQPRFMCQITQLVPASRPMSVRDIRQDIRPLFNGNISLSGHAIATLTMLFNGVQKLRGGADFPLTAPMLAEGPTPSLTLDLKAGEWVEVRDKIEIGLTLVKAHNRGMWFGRETLRFCNQPFRVQGRVERIIHERTGGMIHLGTPGVILEQVCGSGEFLRLCPQNEYVFWREIWLRRVDSPRAPTK
jgi:hypothetical protein